MMDGVREYTSTGKIKRPSYETIVAWVKASWESVDTSLIRKSFKCCGISTKRDGTENDLIFDYDRLSVLSNQSNQVVTTDADVEEQTLRESQEFIPIVNNYITIDEEVGDNHYDENELNYTNIWNN